MYDKAYETAKETLDRIEPQVSTAIKDGADFSDHLIGNVTLIEGKINKLKSRQIQTIRDTRMHIKVIIFLLIFIFVRIFAIFVFRPFQNTSKWPETRQSR